MRDPETVLHILLRVVVFAVVVLFTFAVETVVFLFITGEVSCYRVCSSGTRWFENAAPWPAIGAWALALGAGYGASRLVRR